MKRVAIDLGHGASMAAHVADDVTSEDLEALAAIGRAVALLPPLTPEQVERQDRMRARLRSIRERADAP